MSTKTASRPTKRSKHNALTTSKKPPTQKPSNRPRYSASEDDSEDSENGLNEVEERAAMLAALEAHQALFLRDAGPAASTSAGWKGKGVAVAEASSVWDGGMDEFDDAEANSEEDSEDDEMGSEGEELPRKVSVTMDTSSKRNSGPTVISFEEPRVAGVGTNKDMRKFMSSKVKNSRPTFSLADEMNATFRGKTRQGPAANNTEEEAHLATLDTHLSDMLRPLTAPSNSTTHSQLPQLLSSLPMAPTKALKGLTPLPPNAPRTLRRGQAAANLKRAQGRDAANGILAGARNGREALSLKEKRAKEGEKRERGLGASLGKMKGGGLTLSREEIARGNGEAPRGSRGGRGGRGGSRGGRGASRGRGRK